MTLEYNLSLISHGIVITVPGVAWCLALKKIVTSSFHIEDGAWCKCEWNLFFDPLILNTVTNYNRPLLFMNGAHLKYKISWEVRYSDDFVFFLVWRQLYRKVCCFYICMLSSCRLDIIMSEAWKPCYSKLI